MERLSKKDKRNLAKLIVVMLVVGAVLFAIIAVLTRLACSTFSLEASQLLCNIGGGL